MKHQSPTLSDSSSCNLQHLFLKPAGFLPSWYTTTALQSSVMKTELTWMRKRQASEFLPGNASALSQPRCDLCHHRWTWTRKMYPLSPKEFWTGRKAGGDFVLVTAGEAWKAVSSNLVRLRINSHVQDAGIGMQNLEPTQSGEKQRLLWSAGDVTFATVLSEIHWFRDCTSADYSWRHT